MHYVHASHQMFEAGNNFPVVNPEQEERADNLRQLRHNMAVWTGGVLTGAALTVAGMVALNAYERAMQTAPVAVEQVQTTEVTDDGSFSVGTYVAPH